MADEERQEPKAEFERMQRFKNWFKVDKSHAGEWRKDAEAAYDFVAGKQWSDADVAFMKSKRRVPVTFNRVLSVIKSVAGSEINNRQELKFLPRNVDDEQEGPTGNDSTKSEFLSGVSDWMADQAEAEDEQSEAFEDSLICGMGWSESRLDFEIDPDGEYVEERIDPLEMLWDSSARKKNLVDAKRLWRVRSIPAQDALAMHPDHSLDEIDANWASMSATDSEAAGTPIEQRKFHMSGEARDLMTEKVTVVELQWIEKEPFFRVILPQPDGQEAVREVSAKAHARIKKLSPDVESVKQVRRVYRRAFLGRDEILGDETENHAGEQFAWQCITGERNRNKGTFFGLVAVMREPQMWANKWLSQLLHIINRSAKGGVIAEKGVAADQRQFEQSWAKAEEVTWAAQGKLQKNAIQPKPEAVFPAGFMALTEFAVSSIKDVSGVNLELLGLRDVNQPGILEAQRKQAAMTILATAFNSLRRYRKRIGAIRLHYIQNHLSDGRMIRIMGEQGAEIMPIAREKTVGTFDVIVDESASSPNQKEATWGIIMSVVPSVREMITPEVMLELLKFSPLPESLVSKLQTMLASGEEDPEAMEARRIALQTQLAELEAKQAQTALDTARAQKTKAETIQTAAETMLLGTEADPNVASSETAPFPA